MLVPMHNPPLSRRLQTLDRGLRKTDSRLGECSSG
jgi:hypothetical protein